MTDTKHNTDIAIDIAEAPINADIPRRKPLSNKNHYEKKLNRIKKRLDYILFVIDVMLGEIT